MILVYNIFIYIYIIKIWYILFLRLLKSYTNIGYLDKDYTYAVKYTFL